MTAEQFKKVHTGDILRNVSGSEAYVVVGDVFDKDGERNLILVRQITASNPVEWIKVA